MLSTGELTSKQNPTKIEQTVVVTRDELDGIGSQQDAERAACTAVCEGIGACDKGVEGCCLKANVEASKHGGNESLVFTVFCTAEGCASDGIKRAVREIGMTVEEGKEALTHKSPEKA